MSNNLLRMIMAGCGYRTENFSGSGERSLYEVIRHELSAGNTDIVAYLQATAKILLDYTADDADELADVCQANAPYVAEEIVEYVAKKLGAQCVHALWLTTLPNVIALYNARQREGIDCYSLPSRFVVLSDLGDDGALFAYSGSENLIKSC